MKAERIFGRGKVICDPVRTSFPDPHHARRAVTAIQALTSAGETVFVHCSHGQERTGIVIAAWRILVDGWTIEDADEERRRFGGIGGDEARACLESFRKRPGCHGAM